VKGQDARPLHSDVEDGRMTDRTKRPGFFERLMMGCPWRFRGIDEWEGERPSCTEMMGRCGCGPAEQGEETDEYGEWQT
jgi:hypothetical protein